MYLTEFLQSNYTNLRKQIHNYVFDIVNATLTSDKKAYDVFNKIVQSKLDSGRLKSSDFQEYCKCVKKAVIDSNFEWDDDDRLDIERYYLCTYRLELLTYVMIEFFISENTHYNCSINLPRQDLL